MVGIKWSTTSQSNFSCFHAEKCLVPETGYYHIQGTLHASLTGSTKSSFEAAYIQFVFEVASPGQSTSEYILGNKYEIGNTGDTRNSFMNIHVREFLFLRKDSIINVNVKSNSMYNSPDTTSFGIALVSTCAHYTCSDK